MRVIAFQVKSSNLKVNRSVTAGFSRITGSGRGSRLSCSCACSQVVAVQMGVAQGEWMNSPGCNWHTCATISVSSA